MFTKMTCSFKGVSYKPYSVYYQYHPDLLIDEMRDKPGAGDAARLVVAPVAALEVEDESLEEQLADVGELGVHHGRQGSVHVREGRGGHLRRDGGLAEDTPAAHHVLREELPHDDADVGRIDLKLM